MRLFFVYLLAVSGCFAGLSEDEALVVREKLVGEWETRVKAERAEEFARDVVKVGDREMRYLVKTFGEKPESGRRLFISMHGGGNAPAALNDSQWKNQIRLYQPEEGIVVAPRAPTNTWNLWHEGHIDGLFDRLIENFVVLAGVDREKVYLMGYSAGGDGVYQLAPRMADRFAAAAMMAGHPNETVPLGLRNLPLTLHVGGDDAAFDRNKIVPQWGEKLASLRKADPGGYVHEAVVHAGKPHWMGLEDKVAVPWMMKFKREALPERVVWKQDDVTHRRFYWLGMPEESVKSRQLIRVRRDGQIFEIEEADEVSVLTILLNDEMVDMDEAVVVKMGEKVLFEGVVERERGVMERTLRERGDLGLVFSGEVLVKFGE